MVTDERVVSLRAILRKFLTEDFLSHKRWPGMEWGKALFGNSVLGAMEEIGLDRGKELREAIEDAKRALRNPR